MKQTTTKLGMPYSNCTKTGKLAFFDKYTEEHCLNECSINRLMVKQEIRNKNIDSFFDHRKEHWLSATVNVRTNAWKMYLDNLATFLAPFFPDKIPSGLYRNCSLFVEITKYRELEHNNIAQSILSTFAVDRRFTSQEF